MSRRMGHKFEWVSMMDNIILFNVINISMKYYWENRNVSCKECNKVT